MKTAISRFVRPVRRLIDAIVLMYDGGIGDFLLLSTVARELKRRGLRRLYIITEFVDLYRHNPDVDGAAPAGSRRARLFIKLAGERVKFPSYLIAFDPITEERIQPPEPILPYMCRLSGITGRVDLRPYFSLTKSERAWGEPYRGAVAIQSSGLAARVQMRNKQWPTDRMAEVAAHLLSTRPVVQIGAASDPPVPCTHDLRGKTTVRQLAAVLAHCRMFVGLVGMPMHLARAVDCPSVIVYGGRERPDQTGYICNENVYNPVHCAPCWLDSRCDHGRVCMETLPASWVIAAADRLLSRPREGLAVASYEIL